MKVMLLLTDIATENSGLQGTADGAYKFYSVLLRGCPGIHQSEVTQVIHSTPLACTIMQT